MDLKDKKVTVIGLAKTGIALIKFLKNKGARVFASDSSCCEKMLQILKEIFNNDLDYETNGNTQKVYENADLIVISPGVSIHIPVIKEAKRRNIPVIGEVELAYNFLKGKLVSVTGTNGKSTTTTLIYNILKEKYDNVFIAGNIGNPVINEVEKLTDDSILVTEISNFQLETTEKFRPYLTVLTNITPDHLDRHKDFEEYRELKLKIFKNQTSSDWAVLNADDKLIIDNSDSIKARKIYFSKQENNSLSDYSYVKDGDLYFILNGKNKKIMNIKEVLKDRFHNFINFQAAVTASLIMGAETEHIARGIEKFNPLKHRLENVGTFRGINFIDDSKGTNPGAVIQTLSCFDTPIILIAGGKDKNCDYSELAKAVNKKVKYLILIGEAADRIYREVKNTGFTSVAFAKTLKEAVGISFEKGSKQDTVILSPACSSFDMFNSAEERGDLFKEYVKNYE